SAVPDDLPFVTGPIGPMGSPPSREMMAACDTLLVVGARCLRRDFLPTQARSVRIDIDPDSGAALIGDSRATLAALLPLLDRRDDRRFREQVERAVRRWWSTLAADAQDDAEPIHPQRVFGELSARLPEHCIVTCEAGACTHWFARDVRLRRGMSAALSGALATPGSAVPYAVAAKYAQPGRPVVALLGDAAMQMSGINGLLTVAHVWREWANPRLVVMVLSSGDLDEAGWQRRLFDDAAPPEPPVEFPYAAYAELIGLRGIRVDHPQGVGPAWAAALGSDMPTLVEMVTDPRVPPLPPHASPEQLRTWRDAILSGTA
ncbi:MAG: thiamine pyrophosphate-dependent enzyme, partial [Betaproteobacteria bacterium]